MDDKLTPLIEASDLASLSRHVDAVCARRAWNELVELRDRCDEAVERGKQVWGISQFAEYRLALEAPVAVSVRAGIFTDGRGRFSLGPLWEVAASTHPWEDFASHALTPTIRALIAHERAIRGETIPSDAIDHHVIAAPVEIQLWEPAYPVAEYKSDRAVFPDDLFDIDMGWEDLPDAAEVQVEDGLCHALMELVKPWWEDSLGKSEAITVDASIEAGIRSLGPRRARLADVPYTTAMEAMVWAGASGGGHGRRRGSPTGRAGAWWVLLEALGYEEMPEDRSGLGDEAQELRWVLWDPGDRVGGWNLHLGIEDPDDGIAWVLSAVDAV
ncbi:MAG: hypothetical protein R2823_06950 [Acidimicrobiia bacterium]